MAGYAWLCLRGGGWGGGRGRRNRGRKNIEWGKGGGIMGRAGGDKGEWDKIIGSEKKKQENKNSGETKSLSLPR